jgi:hypothetical protein
MDWGDLLMHGAPWIWLLVTVLRLILARRTAPTDGAAPPK